MFLASAIVGSVLLGDFDDGKGHGRGMSVKPPNIHDSAEHANIRPALHRFIEKATAVPRDAPGEANAGTTKGLLPLKRLNVGEELVRDGDWEEGRGGDDPVKGLCWGALTSCLPFRAPEEDALTNVEISPDAPL